jgi:chaperonin GroES
MKLKPLDDRVVIQPNQAEDVTAGGIVLPDSAKERPLMGKIIAVGEGKLLDNGSRAKLSVKKNDVVLFGKYGGSDVEVDDIEYKIMRESEILAIVEK